MRKLKFYLIGLIPGLLFVAFVLNKKGVSCSGYLPNQRVIAESLTKDFTFQPAAKLGMSQLNVSEKQFKDSLFMTGKIDFEKSNAQKEPCPDYYVTLPEDQPIYEMTFEKCQEKVIIKTFKKLP